MDSIIPSSRLSSLSTCLPLSATKTGRPNSRTFSKLPHKKRTVLESRREFILHVNAARPSGGDQGRNASNNSTQNDDLVTSSLGLAASKFLLSSACAAAVCVTAATWHPSDALAYKVGPEGPQPCADVAGYYSPAMGLKGEALRGKLHDIISPHKVYTYTQAWEALKVLDADDERNPENANNVVEVYTRKAVPKTLAADAQGWNREHLWPRSYGLVQGEPEFSDLHNLRPSDVNVNSSRGNKWYGECGAVLEGAASCLIPANREAAPDTAASRLTWAPPGEVRGDIARALLYMDVRYDGKDGSSFDLELSDTPNIQKAQMGLLSELLRWHERDPPSASERLRNDRVCQLYQHNRNPFVDHPEFVSLIWDAKTGSGAAMIAAADQAPLPAPGTAAHAPAVVAKPPPSSPKTSSSQDPKLLSAATTLPYRGPLPAWLNEIHYENAGPDEGEFLEVILRDSVSPDDVSILLYNGSTGQPYAKHKLASFTRGPKAGGGTVYSTVLPSNKIQNGPDGVVLVLKTGQSEEAIQFLSYEGAFVALEGPAKGFKAQDVGVAESGKTPKGASLGLVGSGRDYKDFRWQAFGKASPGTLNVEQTLN